MFNRLIRLLAISITIVGLAVACVPEDTEYVVGKVESVNEQTSQLELEMENGEVTTFTVPRDSLMSVKPGHEVELEIVQDKVVGLENFDASS